MGVRSPAFTTLLLLCHKRNNHFLHMYHTALINKNWSSALISQVLHHMDDRSSTLQIKLK